MATISFHLISLSSSSSSSSFLTSLRAVPVSERALWLGHCLHWVHEPKFSATALLGPSPQIHTWDYLLVTASPSLPSAIASLVSTHWSITTSITAEHLAAYPSAHAARLNGPIPSLPPGWSPADPHGLKAARPPSELEASLALVSRPFRPSSQPPITLQNFIPSRPATPVAMFGLLAYLPGRRDRYFEYVAAFTASVGSKYGGDAALLGLGVKDWSSRGDEMKDGEDAAGWEDVALIWYPSIWHFGKMLDDEAYVEADRKFKTGTLRDNPLLCCEEVVVEYDG